MTAGGATRSRPVPGTATARRQLRRAPAWWRDAVATAAGVSVLVVVALWARGHGVQQLVGSPSEQLTATGRLAGLVAADLLLIQVLLLARVPMIERAYGQDELARRHRLMGFWSITLLLLHIALITVGYALAAHDDVMHETWTLLASYGGMLLALAGTTALTVVTVTSVRVARRRLRYESWHLLHLYAYLGVGLALPHEVWTGQDFAGSSAARLYWWSAYGVTAGAALTFRVAVPVLRTVRHGIHVISVVLESPDVVTVRMGGRGLHRLPVQAGQFFVFRFLDGPGWSRGNPYSLSAAPRHDRIQVTAKDLGDGSARLSQLRPGTPVLIEGPYGRLTAEVRTADKLLMLACGIGITPVRALLEDLTYRPGDATLVYRARSAADLVFRTELDELAAQRGIAVHYLVGPRVEGRASWLPRQLGQLGDVTALRRFAPELLRSDVYVCGPDAWMDAVCAAALAAGLPRQQLHVERFTW